ncbi:MAG: 3-deoxy-D-manno-octulosonic acid transferase [Gammaproteobacteria bacterium]|nr:3-deoxy-D-manno-octulosonic acid transferase [Gammaproteobacteria bacterium]
MRFFYNFLSYLVAPLFVSATLWRGFKNHAYWQRLHERFGFVPAFDRPVIWIHAVSVGEVHAAAPFVRSLIKDFPGYEVLITTVTPTGAERVNKIFDGSVHHAYIPYDLPGSVKRFFKRVKPHLAMIIEKELWPNLYHACGVRRIPLVLASAQMSPHSVNKYKIFTPLFKEALSHGILIAAQTEADAERFESIGANPKRIHVVGNIKFDFALADDIQQQGKSFRQRHWPQRVSWIAASTHEGEEALLINVWRAVREVVPQHLWILVPRHPERFDKVKELLRSHGLNVVTRTSGRQVADDTDVFLLDTIGELTQFYSAADVAFVAGSFEPIGGHNLLEPASLGLPVLTGPYNFNGEEIANQLIAAGGARKVVDQNALVAELIELLGNTDERTSMGKRGLTVVETNRGAVERLQKLIGPLIEHGSFDEKQPNSIYSPSH